MVTQPLHAQDHHALLQMLRPVLLSREDARRPPSMPTWWMQLWLGGASALARHGISLEFKAIAIHTSCLGVYFIKFYQGIGIGGAFSQSLGGPKALKPEPQSSGKESFSGMYPWSITDMCCCQPAAAVAHLLPVLKSSRLRFVAPKQGPDSGPQNGATILKLVAQLPNSWPKFWAHVICVLPSVKSALSCDRLHLSFMFLALGARMLVSHAGYAVKEGKKHAGPKPQKWARVAAQAKGTFQKVQGFPCCSAASMRGWTLTVTSNAKTCVQPAAVYRTLGAPPGTPRHQSWHIPALCKAATRHQERQQDWLLWVATLTPGERGHVCMRISTYITRKQG